MILRRGGSREGVGEKGKGEECMVHGLGAVLDERGMEVEQQQEWSGDMEVRHRCDSLSTRFPVVAYVVTCRLSRGLAAPSTWPTPISRPQHKRQRPSSSHHVQSLPSPSHSSRSPARSS